MQLNLKLKIKKNMRSVRGCSLHPDGRMVFSCSSTNTVRCFTKDGVEIFQIWKEKNDRILMIQYILKITIVIGGDRSANINWACLFFSLAKVNSQGFDSTTTSPNWSMMVVIFFKVMSILHESLV
jgi:WD40 repeat protein